MARLYADENFNHSAVLELRKLGQDVLTVQEAGRHGRDDPTVLADATADGRAVITHNRFHFVGLHADRQRTPALLSPRMTRMCWR